MGTRFFHPGLDPTLNNTVDTNTDILGDNPQIQAARLLIPQIAKKSRNALQVTPVPFVYFQRLKVGRRCSCYTLEAEPGGECRNCYGTGVVSGFQKLGTRVQTIEVTHPNVRCVNVFPDYNTPTRPIYFTLSDTAVYGYIETDIEINTPNKGIVDVIDLVCTKSKHNSVDAFVKSGMDTDFVPLTVANLAKRLGFSRLLVRVVLKRDTPKSDTPKFVGLRLAYNLRNCLTFLMDIPRHQESLTLEDFGIYESFSNQTLYTDNSIKNCSNEDFVYNVRDGLRWKITEVSDNRPLGILTSWDLTARLVQTYEKYGKIPVGNVDKPCETPPRKILSYVQKAEDCEPCPTDFKSENLQSLRQSGKGVPEAQQTREPNRYRRSPED